MSEMTKSMEPGKCQSSPMREFEFIMEPKSQRRMAGARSGAVGARQHDPAVPPAAASFLARLKRPLLLFQHILLLSAVAVARPEVRVADGGRPRRN